MNRAMTDVAPIPHQPLLLVGLALPRSIIRSVPMQAFACGGVDGDHNTGIRPLPLQFATLET